jgi:hypothetical protein
MNGLKLNINMKHKIISFYAENLNPVIVELQKKVFEKLDIPLEQVKFNGSHGSAIKNYLDTNDDWDVMTMFDVDCIPLNKKAITDILDKVDDDTIYGNAQISNSFPYAAPSFLSFTKSLYDSSTNKSFEPAYYPNEDNVMVEADCSEIFVKENIKRGKKMVLSYPTNVLKEQWYYYGNETYPPFNYGNGTTFDNDTYHCFQIRLPEVQDIFINYVNNFLNE